MLDKTLSAALDGMDANIIQV
jgi:magnesium chelatase family protein